MTKSKQVNLRPWTTKQIAKQFPTVAEMETTGDYRVMTQAEVLADCMSVDEVAELMGDQDSLLRKWHRKIRRRGKAKAGPGQLLLPLEKGKSK